RTGLTGSGRAGAAAYPGWRLRSRNRASVYTAQHQFIERELSGADAVIDAWSGGHAAAARPASRTQVRTWTKSVKPLGPVFCRPAAHDLACDRNIRKARHLYSGR